MRASLLPTSLWERMREAQAQPAVVPTQVGKLPVVVHACRSNGGAYCDTLKSLSAPVSYRA